MTIKQFNLGYENAPIQIELYVNVACPGSANFYQVALPTIKSYVEQGNAHVAIKLWDKPKIELVNGTIVHLSIDYTQQEKSLQIIETLLATHDQWRTLNSEEVKTYLQQNHGLQEQIDNTVTSLEVANDAAAQGVFYLPGFVLNKQLHVLTPGYTTETVEGILQQYVAVG